MYSYYDTTVLEAARKRWDEATAAATERLHFVQWCMDHKAYNLVHIACAEHALLLEAEKMAYEEYQLIFSVVFGL